MLAVLAKYVVLTRGQPGCRNVDLCLSVTTPDRFVIIQKWEPPEAQAATSTRPRWSRWPGRVPLLASPPSIDLLEGICAHDLN